MSTTCSGMFPSLKSVHCYGGQVRRHFYLFGEAPLVLREQEVFVCLSTVRSSCVIRTNTVESNIIAGFSPSMFYTLLVKSYK